MTRFFRMIGTVGLIAGMLFVYACGNIEHETRQGKVVKGPVVGATVRDSNGILVGTTDAQGNFPMTGTAPYYSTGGTYASLNVDGTQGANIAAPPMSAPAGVSQITPLSTTVNVATIAAAKPTATADEKAALTNLLAVINANGGLNIDLSVKTDANAALVNLNETVGAVLAQVSLNAPDSLPTAVTAMITAVSTLPATPLTPVAVLSAISDALTQDLPSLAPALKTAAETASTGSENYPIDQPLPVPTGSTGSNGGTTLN